MTDHEMIALAAEHHELVNTGLKAGLAGTTILQLIQMFGPTIAQLLIQILLKKQAGGGVTPAPMATMPDLTVVKMMLVALLTQYKAQILALLDSNEAALLDILIAKLSA